MTRLLTDIIVSDGVAVSQGGIVHATCEYSAICGHYRPQPGRAWFVPLWDFDVDHKWEELNEWWQRNQFGYWTRSLTGCSFCRELVLHAGGDDDD